MAATLYLDNATWDLALDGDGNVAKASEPYALALAAANECRCFSGECWYDSTKGIPYSTQILGKSTPIEYTKAQLVAAALNVPNVIAAKAYLTSSSSRKLGGQIQITDNSGIVTAASF